MAGMDSTAGTHFPFSQLKTVRQVVSNGSAAAFWLSLSSSRRFLKCSPSVLASNSLSFGFRPLSVIGVYGKKATRPCPCGYLGHHSGKCQCTPQQVARYRRRISGPLLDRIDIHIEVPAVAPDEIAARSAGEASSAIRGRVAQARERQIARQGKPNAQLSARGVEQHATPDQAGQDLLKQAISRLGLSARGYHRILKVARSIADLIGDEIVSASHIAEAIQYRRISGG